MAGANKLLDEAGLKMGPDGKTRLRPDGQPLEVVIETENTPGSAGLDEVQRIAVYWTNVGIKTSVKVGRALALPDAPRAGRYPDRPLEL